MESAPATADPAIQAGSTWKGIRCSERDRSFCNESKTHNKVCRTCVSLFFCKFVFKEHCRKRDRARRRHSSDHNRREGKEFPLLIKILDAKDDLSIQIHPNDEYAAKHENGSLGKTECWYVLDCEPGATIIVGQRAKDRVEAAQMIEEGRWDDMLNVLPIHKGDFFQIDSGTVHAIKTGTLILETQQSSDVTYRLYDYDRPGTDGKLRPLHIEQSLDCIDFDAQAPTDGTVTAPEVDGVTELESNPCYTVDRVRVDGSKTLDQRWPFMCLSVIDGEGTVCGDPVHKGSHLLAPSTVSSIDLEGKMELIISHL